MSGGGKMHLMQQVWHRLVGVRGATNIFVDQCSTKGTSNFGMVYPSNSIEPKREGMVTSASAEISRHRLVFFGEIHSMPPIIALQREVQASMARQTDQLHVVLEHFSFDLQHLLDDFSAGKITFQELVEKYHEIGEEGHNLEPYQGLLEDARDQGSRIHAGFIPRPFARMLLKEGEEATVNAASQWLPALGNLKGTDFHYNVFESFFTGRSIYPNQESYDEKVDTSWNEPTDQFRRIFQAQILKDVSMAQKVSELIKDDAKSIKNGHCNSKYLVIAGNGHMLHYCGVPERVLSENPELMDETCLVVSESTSRTTSIGEGDEQEAIRKSLIGRFGREGSNPADYVYLYEIPDEIIKEWDEESAALESKEETRRAYDKVGESARLPGNMLKAAWIMYSMGYSEEQFQAAGPDAYNFQGVGNPHIHANIQPGENVLDVGSGLGIDSFVAAAAAGNSGQVLGIDLSHKQVQHAQSCANERGMTNVQFQEADMERLPLPDDSIDVIISNGAFCLAPNKRKAFEELYRVLKPGGRISVCTTTTTQKEGLEPGVSWPLCMQMFISKDELSPMCEDIGFTKVVIDDNDSSMTMEIPEEVWKDANPERNRVHVGGEDFKHLENFDMDEICARVCVVAEKPHVSAAVDDTKTHE